MWKIQITKKNESVEVAEVNTNILGALISYSLKTRKPFNLKHSSPYSFSPVPLSICNPSGTSRHKARAN